MSSGLLAGLILGCGLFLLVVPGGPPRLAGLLSRRRSATERLLSEAGVAGIAAHQVLLAALGGGLLAGLTVLALTGTAPLAAAFAVFAALAPRSVLRRRAAQRAALLREAWPDVVDNLASAVRAGLSLPEALGALAGSGPELLRPAFAGFAEEHRRTGATGACLDNLARALADPVGDRVIEALRLTREVGGTDLGLLLRTLSAFLRADARTRAEVEARQSWTVNAARLALAAPWLILLLLATQTATIRAYNSGPGVAVLVTGGSISYAAYRLMRRIARLPQPRRREPGGSAARS